MARKGRAPIREVEADPVYGSVTIARAINKIMADGKKAIAEKILYESLDLIEEQTGREPVEVFEEALSNVMPMLEVKSRRVGGATYQVPVEVNNRRKRILGLRWMMESAKNRSERRMSERVTGEVLDALNEEGAAIRRKEEVHRMAEANKAFAHYRW